MKVSHFIYGRVCGSFKTSTISNESAFSTRRDIEYNSIELKEPNIEKRINIKLDEFKVHPFAELKKHKITLVYEALTYDLEFDQVILNDLKIIKTTKGEDDNYYNEFEADLYTSIDYLEDIPIVVDDPLPHISDVVTNDVVKEAPNQKSNTGCFQSIPQKTKPEGGCFSPKYSEFYQLNKNDLTTKVSNYNQHSQTYWSEQKANVNSYVSKNHNAFSGFGMSFFSWLSFAIICLAILLLIVGSTDIFKSMIFVALMSFTTYFSFARKPFCYTLIARIIRFILLLFSCFIIATYLFKFVSIPDFDYDRDRVDDTEIIEIPDETSETDSGILDSTKVDFKKAIKRNHHWEDFNSNNYREEFITSVQDYSSGKKFINNMNLTYNGLDFWGKLYSSVSKYEFDRNEPVFSMYKSLLNDSKASLSSIERLNAIITSIQTIPYYLVHEGSCQMSMSGSDFSRQYHFKGEPCVANVKYGLAAPSQFMGNFKGDCDTRALFLYIMLKKLGYDVAVLVSEKYGHAILGVNIAGNGKSVKFRGKRYLTVETTSEGWRIGQLPPNCQNTRYWRVALN
jgi:hypothetical protein